MHIKFMMSFLYHSYILIYVVFESMNYERKNEHNYMNKFWFCSRDSVIGNQAVVSRFEMKQVASFADHESPVINCF